MSLAAVIRALHGAGIHPTGREIAEALWLAQHLAPPTASQESRLHQPLADENAGGDLEQTPTTTPYSAEPIRLSTTTSAAVNFPVRGHPVRIPDVPGLNRRQDVQRALRPLRRYGPSPRHRVIDEDATATFIANTGVWTPVTHPAPERWFDIVLAVDSSPSMDLWRPLISDLRAALIATGAFRDVRTWRLRPQREATILPPTPHSAARSPRELIDGTGRRLFLVVTDGAAGGWHDGSAMGMLADWCRTGPVAFLQPLPEQMWPRTGLVPVPVMLSAHALGTCNSQLQVDYRRRRRISGIPIPVLGIEPHALHSWARLVTGSASTIPLAATPVSGDEPSPSSVISQNEPGIAVVRFRASASPQAYQLAICLSAVPLTLPIMRLVQHIAVPESNPSALAEVILGGLIAQTSVDTYEFLPGIRETLLGQLRRSETALVFAAVSDYVTQHAGTANQTFAAIAERADGPVTADAEAFSWVPPAAAARLGLPDVTPPHQTDQQVPRQATAADSAQHAAADHFDTAILGDEASGYAKMTSQRTGSNQPFWDLLTPDDQRALRDLGSDRQYPPGAILCVEGDPSTHVFVLLRGWVKVMSVTGSGYESVRALRGEGDLVGETAGATGGRRNATMQAIDTVHALIVAFERFNSFLDTHPRASHAFRQMMMQRSSDVETTLGKRSFTNGAQRVAGLLLELAERHGSQAGDGIQIELPLSQEELASLAGTSRTTVTRALNNWRQRGFIRTGPRRITLMDVQGLRRAAGPA
jgi:CRP-like cAMP-binding protein